MVAYTALPPNDCITFTSLMVPERISISFVSHRGNMCDLQKDIVIPLIIIQKTRRRKRPELFLQQLQNQPNHPLFMLRVAFCH